MTSTAIGKAVGKHSSLPRTVPLSRRTDGLVVQHRARQRVVVVNPARYPGPRAGRFEPGHQPHFGDDVLARQRFQRGAERGRPAADDTITSYHGLTSSPGPQDSPTDSSAQNLG